MLQLVLASSISPEHKSNQLTRPELHIAAVIRIRFNRGPSGAPGYAGDKLGRGCSGGYRNHNYPGRQALVWPNFAIGAGALTTASVLLFLRRSGRKHYAASGTAYCLGLAALIYTTSLFPEGYAESPFAVLLGLGLVSGLIVALQIAAQRGFERVVVTESTVTKRVPSSRQSPPSLGSSR